MSESDNLDLSREERPEESVPSPFDQAPVPDFDPAPVPGFGQTSAPDVNGVFWGWHDVFLFLMCTVLAIAITMLAGFGLRNLFHISDTRMNIVFMLAQILAYGVSFAALKLMFRAEYGEPLLASLHWLPAGIDPAKLVFIGLGQAFTIAVLSAFMNIPQMETPMSRLLADRPTAIVIAVLGVTIAPLAEELAFRGLLQPLMVRTIGVIPGILVTSLLFGAMHLAQYGAWQSVVLITLAGAGFGAMRHVTGSTRASAIMHAGYNSTLFILFFTQKGVR